MRNVSSFEDDCAAVLLSGGVDSASVACALRAVGKEVVAYSFRLDGVVSTDFSFARQSAKRLGIKFVPVVLPSTVEAVKQAAWKMIGLGFKKKADIECGWPISCAIDAVEERVLLTGHGADGNFGLSKKAMIHCRHDTSKLDQYRRESFARPDYAQTETMGKYAKDQGKLMVCPYMDKEMVDLFMGTSWNDRM